MTLETGLIWAMAIMSLGGVGLVGFAIWLRKKPRYPRDDGPLSEAASERIRQIAQPMLQKGPIISDRTIYDWLAEITMVETGEKIEYRLSRIADDPDA